MEFELFYEGDSLYEAMLLSIGSSTRSIEMESYIFADDEVGNSIGNALAEKAQSGVRVRLHLDAAGSLFWISRKMVNRLCRAGVEIRWFHRWQWRAPWRYNQRNHRKLLVSDERHLFLGGFNIHRENSKTVYGDCRWRDTHIAVTGPLARTASLMFNAFWAGRLHWAPPGDNSGMTLAHTQSGTCRHQIRCVYLNLIANARASIFLTTPYFVPDSKLIKELVNAAKRGISVNILVPCSTDMPFVHWAAHALYARLMTAGVKIYEYQPRILHAKTAVIDDEWSITGTANMDYRSLFTNYELCLVSRNQQLAKSLNNQFKIDLQESLLLQCDSWQRRAWVTKLAEYYALRFRRWL